jgi:predicted transposase YbfD/YdcC
MDQQESTTLVEVFNRVPDPRKPRGKRHPWPCIWTIIATAVLSGQRSPHAIAHWAHLHAQDLLAALQPPRPRRPSEATFRRALRQIDCATLEQLLAQFTPAAPPPPLVPPAPPPSAHLEGQAVDGKAVRGAGRHGPRPHLVSLTRHHDACVLAQTAVTAKRHESSAVPALLHGRDLTGVVITMDAGLTQRKLATQILEQHGHYLMVVKRNQRQLYEDLALFFTAPPLPSEESWRVVQTMSKGHGRIETRTLTCTADLEGYVHWPGVQQVLRRECERIVVTTGEVTRSVTYGLTSAPPREASAAELEALWRGHWTIENQVHYVRDVTLGEDAGQAACGATPQVLAAVRNGVLTLLRRHGWRNIADAVAPMPHPCRRHSSSLACPSLDFDRALSMS